jgi:hypothetical protein
MANKTVTKYNIMCRGRKIYSSLSEEEYFDVMEDLAIQYYQTGSPDPQELTTEMIEE